MPDERTLYDVLGVDRDATPQQLKRAYRRQVLLTHPDTGEADRSRVRRVLEAHRVLSDPDRRRRYDARLAVREGGPDGHNFARLCAGIVDALQSGFGRAEP